MKQAERERRSGNETPIAYHVTDTTSLEGKTLKQFLAHILTKDRLTVYLAKKLMSYGQLKGINLIIAYQDKCIGVHRPVNHLQSSQLTQR